MKEIRAILKQIAPQAPSQLSRQSSFSVWIRRWQSFVPSISVSSFKALISGGETGGSICDQPCAVNIGDLDPQPCPSLRPVLFRQRPRVSYGKTCYILTRARTEAAQRESSSQCSAIIQFHRDLSRRKFGRTGTEPAPVP
jgi:hypothetical protein